VSRLRRGRAAHPDDSQGASKDAGKFDESVTLIKNDVANIQSKLDEIQDEMKNQVEQLKRIDSKADGYGAEFREKLSDISALKSGYKELSEKEKDLHDRVAAMDSRVEEKLKVSDRLDELKKEVEGIRLDLGSFVNYGKLFFGMGVAALFLYIIATIVNLAITVWTKPV